MIPLEQRRIILTLYNEAIDSGARQHTACEIIGINPKTIQRWNKPIELQDDGRKTRAFVPTSKLSDKERQQIISIVNSKEFCEMTPNQIVPILAEKGQNIASERTFYRVLNDENQLAHRHRTKPKTKRRKSKALRATGPGQLLTWDITYLKTTVVGQFFYLYLFMDIFSRKIVGWQIHEQECGQHASDIVVNIAKEEGYGKNQVDIHSDNGSPMKGATLLATFQKLGITPSYSRPSVSNDNPYSESLFKTLKYCPYYPDQPFKDLHAARKWMGNFVDWYNNHHRHSGIKYVTPTQRHSGLDIVLLATREKTYQQAKKEHPARWSGDTRDWRRQGKVTLNPVKENKITGLEAVKLAAQKTLEATGMLTHIDNSAINQDSLSPNEQLDSTLDL